MGGVMYGWIICVERYTLACMKTASIVSYSKWCKQYTQVKVGSEEGVEMG